MKTLAPICVLATLASCAAPPRLPPSGGPEPRAEAYPGYVWSTPVNGLRGRLVSRKTYFSKTDALEFSIQLQNVTEQSFPVVVPHVMPVIAPSGNHPYADPRSFDCIVVVSQVGHATSINWSRRATVGWVQETCWLHPNGILQLDLRCVSEARDAPPFPCLSAPHFVQRAVQAEFPLERHPGQYQLSGHYEYPPATSIVVKGIWGGRIEFPAITVGFTDSRNTEPGAPADSVQPAASRPSAQNR